MCVVERYPDEWEESLAGFCVIVVFKWESREHPQVIPSTTAVCTAEHELEWVTLLRDVERYRERDFDEHNDVRVCAHERFSRETRSAVLVQHVRAHNSQR
jgi:hypothetical protein